MLLEPGPLSPLADSAFPIAGVRNTLAADAAQLAGQLGLHDAALGGPAADLISASQSAVDVGAGLDLGNAAAAHDGQARDFDSSIGAVAGNADAQGGEIAGLSIDTAADISNAEVEAPGYVEHPGYPADQIPGGGTDTHPRPDPDERPGGGSGTPGGSGPPAPAPEPAPEGNRPPDTGEPIELPPSDADRPR